MPRNPQSKNPHHSLREHLFELLNGGNAHAKFDDVIKNFSPKLRGVKPANLPHSSWMLLEHLRIAQWDILDFSRNPKYKALKWPDDYWPETPAPPTSCWGIGSNTKTFPSQEWCTHGLLKSHPFLSFPFRCVSPNIEG